MEFIKTVVEIVYYALIPSAALVLWIIGSVAVIGALFKKKERPYSRKDKIYSAVDILLLCVFIWCSTRYMLHGFLGQPEGWRLILRDVVAPIANLTGPLSVWSIAVSISRRKTDAVSKYPLSVLLCVFAHAFCMTAHYLIYGMIYIAPLN